ncbi:hypothetical protein Tco_0712106 [Tanacetum coccineum]
MPQRLTKSSIYSRSLGLSACASLESKNEVCLLCEVSPKANPSLQIHLCFFGEQISALKILEERGEVWGDIQVVTGFVKAGKKAFGENPLLTVLPGGDITTHQIPRSNVVLVYEPHLVHGVPPTKRLFKVAMLDPSPEFIGHWGMFGDLGLPIVVIAISVISVSSDSSEDSVATPTGRVILFDTIPTTIPDTTLVITQPTTQTNTTVIPTEIPIIAPIIPPSPDYTPASPDYSHASDTESDLSEDPSLNHIPPLPSISPFLSSADDTTDSNTPDTPPSPTHGTPFTEITSSTQRSPVIPRRRVMILAHRQHIPHVRPYRYHLNRPVHMMTVRKRVGLLPVQQLVVRHSIDHSSSDYFSLDNSARDSSSDSSLEASSDFHSDASSNSSSRHSFSDHSSPDLPSTFAGPSHKRRRSPMTFVPVLSPVFRAISHVRADLIPSPKRVRDYGYLVDVEAKNNECIAYANALRDRGIDARVVVEVIEGVQMEQGRRIVRVESAVTALTKKISELERDNKRLRGTASVESQRVDRLQRDMSRMQRKLRQIRRLRFYDRVRVGRFEAKMLNTRSGASRIREAVNEQSDRQMAKALGVRDAVRNLGPLMRDGVEQEEVGGNGNGGTRECALTWWNSHKRTIGNEAAYAMSWAELMKLMTEELILLCTRMVPNEEDRVERFIRGLPDNIQGNVIAANPVRFQDVIRIANQLMDKKLQGYAARSAESKRRMESNPRDNRGQQPPFKRQNISGQNCGFELIDWEQ